MDYSKWTPNKNRMNCEDECEIMLSPITKTPVQRPKIRVSSLQSNTNSLSILPSHITPPSGLTKFIARNPFDADLTSKLHISVISPSVFKVASPNKKGSPGFTWSIDEIALMQPAKIDEFPMQQSHCSDPEIERNAQEAISRFFDENEIIPSPYDVRKCENEKRIELKTPTQSLDVLKGSHKSKKETTENWSQTILTFPPELPQHVEEILKPYFNFTQEQNTEKIIEIEETNSSNSSNTSLRRKLFSNDDNDSEDELDNSILISPVKCETPITHRPVSPPQSGIFFHGTPLKTCSQIVQRTYGTPLMYSQDCSPCNVSPINNLYMSCQSIKSQNQSKSKLDFTKDMSIEVSIAEEKSIRRSPGNENICKTLFMDNIKSAKEQKNEVKEKNCDFTQMLTENSMKLRYEDKENFVSNNFNIMDKTKFSGFGKSNFNDSYDMQQSNMLSGNYVQQTTYSSVQDTGYQTYSSSNLTSNLDSYSNSIKQKIRWDERIVQADEEVQLSDWRENIKNVISSTPSKFIRVKNNI